LLEKILAGVKELTHAQSGALLVYKGGEGGIRARRWEKIVADPSDADLGLSEAIFGRIEEERKPLLWDDASSDLELGRSPSVMRRQLRSVLATPILHGEDLIGVIYLENNLLTAVFSPDDLEVLQAVAAQAAVSILNARYAQELQGRERLAVEENLRLKALLEPPLEVSGCGSLLGSSKPMREIFRKLERIRDLRVNVLLLGESGTGKGLCAFEIHRHSPLRDRPFVVIECSSIPENLLESELFGYEKGAFTGAMNAKKGKLELADGGTVFLDEIGELSVALQAKFLRFIQDKVLVRLGGTSEIRLDVRIIAATNKNLPEEVRAKRFREDLYYRINDFLVELPPLRDRGQDVVLLAAEKLKVLQKELHKESVHGFSAEGTRFLLTQSWPGNIRQLQSLLRSALIYTDGSEVTEKELSQVQEEDRLRNTLLSESQLRSHLSRLSPAEVERLHLHGALEAAEHNVSLAAERLGLSRTTLTAKIKEYGLKK
ncbi:MAG: sigma 54-interacting transcriptional regulator, partial [Spirochaetia bacterium]|nr:sigma 54-interacting transcriptional regulator [Spirochaetia bacterium]